MTTTNPITAVYAEESPLDERRVLITVTYADGSRTEKHMSPADARKYAVRKRAQMAEQAEPARIEIVSVHKPSQIIAPIQVCTRITEEMRVEDVITAALEAAGEHRSRLFGYGVENLPRGVEYLPAGTHWVYAHRD